MKNLDIVRNPNKERHPNQNIIVLSMKDYVWLVLYVKDKGVRFLKTSYPAAKQPQNT